MRKAKVHKLRSGLSRTSECWRFSGNWQMEFAEKWGRVTCLRCLAMRPKKIPKRNRNA